MTFQPEKVKENRLVHAINKGIKERDDFMEP